MKKKSEIEAMIVRLTNIIEEAGIFMEDVRREIKTKEFASQLNFLKFVAMRGLIDDITRVTGEACAHKVTLHWVMGVHDDPENIAKREKGKCSLDQWVSDITTEILKMQTAFREAKRQVHGEAKNR